MLTKQPGSIPSTFLVPLLIPQKKLYLVSIIVNKITSKFINLLVNWLTTIDTKQSFF